MYISQKHISVNWLAHTICMPVIMEYAVGTPSATSLGCGILYYKCCHKACASSLSWLLDSVPVPCL